MTKELEEFKELLEKQAKRNIPIQTEWSQVQNVDWEAKTMTVVSLLNGLEYFDVLLGLGSFYRKPAAGSQVLIGLIANKEGSYLIEAREVEEFELIDKTGFKCHLKDGNMTVNGVAFSGMVKAPELKAQVDKNTAILQALQQAVSGWTPSPNDGGAAFKALLSSITQMPRADLKNIENETIKHGNGS